MWTLYSQISPSRMGAKPSLSWAPFSRSDLTSVPRSTRPHSSLSRNSYRCDAARLVAMSPGATLRFLPLAIRPSSLGGDVELDAAPRRIDGAHQHADRIADAHGAAGVGPFQDRPDLVELPPVPAQLAHRQEALEAVAEGDERAGGDQAHHLAVELALQRPLEQPALEQERLRDVVGPALDRHRVALAARGPVGGLVERLAARRLLPAADGRQQRAVADEVRVAADRGGEVAVGGRVQAG